MNVIKYPQKEEWDELLKRPVMNVDTLRETVCRVLDDVKTGGDRTVMAYEKQFDHVELERLAVTEEEMDEAERLVSPELKDALRLAHDNIGKFHASQRFETTKVEVRPGVTCWQKAVPIERVGLYIPGGTAPLFSTVLMLATPAKIAGCREIVLCTPPGRDGKVHPAILCAARVAGVNRIVKAGGVQAIGAMAYGTESVPKVYKIFGPGNQYVMAAKQQVSLHDVAIDMPAGPSEVAVLADAGSNPVFVAADLLSQAEHGVDSQVLLVTTDEALVGKVQDLQAAERVVNAGSVFLGSYTPESAGDYASGTNHTLPTNGYATAYSGVNLDSYHRKITFQELTPQGIRDIGPAVELMAAGEHLDAHRNAMTVRLESIKTEMK